MRHDCVLAAQLESMSEGDDGAGTEESNPDAAKALTTKDTKEHRGRSGERQQLTAD
jgi:hypothetical protein